MFNRRRKHRRHHHAASAPHRTGVRRLAVEAMESRLLLTGNQFAGGDLDVSIYNLDTVGPSPYVVISQGDVAGAPAISANDSASRFDSPAMTIHPPANYLTDFFATGQIVTNPTFNDSQILVAGWKNSQAGGDFVDVADRFFSFNHDQGVPATQIVRLLGDDVSYRLRGDSMLDLGSLMSNSTSNLGLTVQILDAGPRVDGKLTATVVASRTLQLPLFDAPLVTPVAENSITQPPVSAPVVEPLVKNDVAPAVPATNPPADSANVAVPSVNAPLAPNANDQVGVVTPSPVVDAILPAGQPAQEERLADAIDDLLSEDTIIGAPSGENYTEYVSDGPSDGLGTTAEFNGSNQTESDLFGSQVQIADGGMIAIDVLVAAAGSEGESMLAEAGTELVATDQSTGTLGELSRVAVMELIEGEAEPGAAEASDHVMVVADNRANSLDTFRVVAEQAGVAIALASPAGPTYLASIATAAVDAANRAMATLVGNRLATETAGALTAADAARHAAFSDLGGAEDEVETTAASNGTHWDRWLAATPLALAVACERALAARKNRREQRDPARARRAAK